MDQKHEKWIEVDVPPPRVEEAWRFSQRYVLLPSDLKIIRERSELYII